MQQNPLVSILESGEFPTALFIIMITAGLLMSLVAMAMTILIWCKIVGKTGNHWAMGLLILVPLANLILPAYIAFSEWPVLKELKGLKACPRS